MGCIIGDFKHIVKIADNYSKQELKKQNIPVLPQHIILFHLIGDKTIKFTDLQKDMTVSKSTLSDALNKYEELGLIEKIESEIDKRNIYIKFTSDGREIWNKLIIIDDQLRVMMFAGISNDKRNEIEDGVSQIQRNLK